MGFIEVGNEERQGRSRNVEALLVTTSAFSVDDLRKARDSGFGASLVYPSYSDVQKKRVSNIGQVSVRLMERC